MRPTSPTAIYMLRTCISVSTMIIITLLLGKDGLTPIDHDDTLPLSPFTIANEISQYLASMAK